MSTEPHSSLLFNATPGAYAQAPQIPGCDAVRALGRGGSGEAWLVRQRKPFDRELVAKVFRPEPDAASMLARFERERAAISALSNSGARDPGLAAIHDAGITLDGRPYVLMQFIDGASVDVAARGLPATAIGELVRQCCLALVSAHEAGLVHQDITPTNVLVSQRSDGARHVTLIDFGLAASAGTRSMLHGTPDWMAPEQRATDGAPITPATDVWALGRLLRALLAESAAGDDHAIGARLSALADECMQSDPAARPANARALLVRIDHAISNAIADALAARTRVRRRRIALVALAAVPCLAAAALAINSLASPRWRAVPEDAVDLIARELGATAGGASSSTLPAGWEPRNVPNGAWILSTERGGTRRILAGEGTDGAHAQIAIPLAQPLAADDAFWLEWTMRATEPNNPQKDESDLFVIVGEGECRLTLEPRRDVFIAMRDHKAATRGGGERGELPALGFSDHDAWVRYRVAREAGRATTLTVERTMLASGESTVATIEFANPPASLCEPAREIMLAVQERQRLEIGEIRLFRRAR